MTNANWQLTANSGRWPGVQYAESAATETIKPVARHVGCRYGRIEAADYCNEIVQARLAINSTKPLASGRISGQSERGASGGHSAFTDAESV